MVLDGNSGYLVPERNVEMLAAKLIDLISKPELWSDMGSIGRKHIEEKYNVHRLALDLESHYDSLL